MPLRSRWPRFKELHEETGIFIRFQYYFPSFRLHVERLVQALYELQQNSEHLKSALKEAQISNALVCDVAIDSVHAAVVSISLAT